MLLSLLLNVAMATSAPAPLNAVPSPRQLAWQQMDCYAFTHFGPNTFTDQEWGHGTEDPNLFNPTHLDCHQWAKALKAGGMKGVIITAKHHDGFCLWPSKYSTHTVAQSKWKDGKGDVLKELSQACKDEGLKFGIYISPWDRNHPAYGTPEYNQVFNHMLEEVLTQYGPIFEVWFDGANGEGPNGKKQVYDWPLFISTVRRLQPNACIFSDGGPDVRWVGNEGGQASETNWSTLDKAGFYPGSPRYRELGEGHENGTDWLPAECDVSIRPGWFYHPDQDAHVKSPAELESLYYNSVGRNSHLLLNVPPNREGLISAPDVESLKAFNERISETFEKNLAADKPAEATNVRGDNKAFAASNVTNGKGDYWATDDGVTSASLTINLKTKQLFDRVVLQEPIQLGQRVKAFSIEAKIDGTWTPLAVGTTIGAKRILKVQPTVADAVRVNIDDAKACPALSSVGLYATPHAGKQDFDPLSETSEQKDARMKWFKEARFGMFIHWGLYSVPAGEWQGKDYDNAGEWLQYTAKIKPADYEPLQQKFNPVNFDAEKWVKIAKNAGMKYIVITSKHHEGFGMWPSAQGTWNIGHTQFHRDPLKELAAACRKGGIRLCFYHSIMDWHHPDYLPRRPWDDRPTNGDSMDAYVTYMKAQLKELLTNYGPIGILWFDGEWENTWTHERGVDLYKYIRTLQPNIIVNNRVDTGRSGNGSAVKENVGDYGTPEQTIPANGIPGSYWETCMTMNGTWGYHDTDHNWKSPETLIRNLVDIASKGGNYLLNVGPTSLGEIPPGSVDRLAAMGRWTKANGEALYDTSASPFAKPLHWGRVTQRPGKLYLHVFDPSQQILLPGLKAKISRVYELAHPLTTFEVTQTDLGPVINLNGAILPDKIDTVLVAQIDGALEVDPVMPVSDASGNIKLDGADAEIHGDTLAYEAPHKALGYWTQKGDYPSWNFRLEKPGEFNVVLEVACTDDTPGGTFEVKIGSQTITGTVPKTGSWDKFVKVKLGPITLVTPGDYTLKVTPKSMGAFALMNLRSVSLTRS